MTVDGGGLEEPVSSASTDPTNLPIFGQAPADRASTPSATGRRRGTFTLGQSGAAPATQGAAEGKVVPLTQRAPHRGTRGDGDWSTEDDLDWELVASLRQQTADRLSQEGNGQEDHQDQRERGRAIILELLGREATERLRAGENTWALDGEERLARAVFDAVFGLGRLQPLVDDPQVENIMIFGADQVAVELTGGRQVSAPPVADSDEELIDFLAFVASRSEVNARSFSPSSPALHLRLDGGARLAAQAWVTPRPQVVIRRHRLTEVSLQDLVDLGALTPVAASFLAAVVRSGRSIVVSGAQGAGKTTMVRALCAEIPRHEVIGTFETEYELHLHEMRERHPYVFAWEARPGSGEVGADGRRAGEFTLNQALWDSFRMNLNRQIVGEVRGPEVVAMLQAMQSGSGSISTTHATHAVGAIEKLVSCVMRTDATHDYALRAVASGIDVIVHVDKQTRTTGDGEAQVTRFVSEIIAVDLGEQQTGYATTHVFRAGPGASKAQPHVLPDEYRSLVRHGFDLGSFAEQQEEVS